MKAFLGVLFATFFVNIQATSYYPGSNVNQIVTCTRAIPISGTLVAVPSEYPKLNFQPGRPGTVWRPAYNRRSLTSSELNQLNQHTLITYLGRDHDKDLSSITRPTDPAVPMLDPTLTTQYPVTISDELLGGDNANTTIVLEWAEDRLGCQLKANWTDLGPNFFPRWYAGRYCEPLQSVTCGIPNQLCYPDLEARYDYITVLNQDCCLVFNPGLVTQHIWQCGWIKVQVPLPTGCVCRC